LVDAPSAENCRRLFAGRARNLKSTPNESAVPYVQYSVPLPSAQQALKQPIGDVTLTLIGTFSDSNVPYYSDCITSTPARLRQLMQSCEGYTQRRVQPDAELHEDRTAGTAVLGAYAAQ